MRNAHAIPPNPETKTTGEMGDHYGRVAMSAPVQILEPVEPPIYAGWWGAICKWWHDLWDDDDDDHRPPPRTVVVVRDPVPVYAPAPCKGCKVTPLKVEPSLRDEVASARRR